MAVTAVIYMFLTVSVSSLVFVQVLQELNFWNFLNDWWGHYKEKVV